MNMVAFRKMLADPAAPTLTDADFFNFCTEREYIRMRRERGDEPPWSDDRVFDSWRFCNVFREDDRTTRWFREHIRDPLANDYRKVLVATIIFRRFNTIAAGKKIKGLLLGDQRLSRIEDALCELREEGVPVFTGAFLVRSPDGYDKIYGSLLSIAQSGSNINEICAMKPPTCQAMHRLLECFPMVAGFQANQIVADLRFTCVLRGTPDRDTWACAGPGSVRGLAWITKTLEDRNSDESQTRVREQMLALAEKSHDPALWPWCETRPMVVMDVSHALCEFDKYNRVKYVGESQKRTYNQWEAFNRDARPKESDPC